MQFPQVSFSSISWSSVQELPNSIGVFVSNSTSKVSNFIAPFFENQGPIVTGLIDKKWQVLAIATATVAALIAARFLLSKPAAPAAATPATTPPSATTTNAPDATKSVDTTEPTTAAASATTPPPAATTTAPDTNKPVDTAEPAPDATVISAKFGPFESLFLSRIPEQYVSYYQTGKDFATDVMRSEAWQPFRASVIRGGIPGAAVFGGLYALYNLSNTVRLLSTAAIGLGVSTALDYLWNTQAVQGLKERIYPTVTLQQQVTT